MREQSERVVWLAVVGPLALLAIGLIVIGAFNLGYNTARRHHREKLVNHGVAHWETAVDGSTTFVEHELPDNEGSE